MPALVDTNILVYRFDRRFPEKRRRATAFLRRGLEQNELRIAHQAIVEFIAAVTCPIGGSGGILPRDEAFCKPKVSWTNIL